MNLLLVILALLVDRVLFDPDDLRSRWQLDGYHKRAASMIAGATSTPALLQLLALLPLILAGWLALWLVSALFGDWVAALASVGILIYTLGPRDLGRSVDRYLQARDSGDQGLALEAAQELGTTISDGSDPRLSCNVAEAVSWAACNRLFAPIFWFAVGGPMGALLYRLAHGQSGLLQPDDTTPDETPQQPLIAWLDWLPARVMAASMALGGNFEGVALAWQGGSAEVSETANRRFVQKAACAAVDSFPDEQAWELLDDTPPVVEDIMALVWRILGIWLFALLLAGLVAMAL